MRIHELLEVAATPFPMDRVKPANPPKYGAAVIPMQPFQQAKQVNAQRMQAQQALDPFTEAYITAALWSSMGDDGEPLDSQYGVDDLADETLMKMVHDCQEFQKTYAHLYQEVGMDDEQAGHDFWLTREGHGAGFWDRNLGQIGDELNKAAKSYGGFDLYVGDDGKIYG